MYRINIAKLFKNAAILYPANSDNVGGNFNQRLPKPPFMEKNREDYNSDEYATNHDKLGQMYREMMGAADKINTVNPVQIVQNTGQQNNKDTMFTFPFNELV